MQHPTTESALGDCVVTFEADTVGDIPGLWVHPANRRPDEAILHFPNCAIKARAAGPGGASLR